jgi:hypothetical protein
MSETIVYAQLHRNTTMEAAYDEIEAHWDV